MSRARVALATRNPGKLRELRAIVAGLGLDLELVPLPAGMALPEEGLDYADNAAAKARAAAQALGVPALGDDSGLEVEALGGGPGARSARYGGPALDDAGRLAHLLAELRGVARHQRGARFVCLAALAEPSGGVATARGECRGRILEAPRGAGGFGYDPVFWIDELGAAMAELPESVKNRVSHRARALAGLRDALAAAHSRAKTSSGVG